MWRKSVSRAMMEKGFSVSPQQCEDKFNDLNKRYKRVNELLGKGTACRVVENQGLLDSLDHLSPKAREEARKLLNSKHLFFREMCAYHNSGAAAHAPAAFQPQPQPQPHHQQQGQHCFHHPSHPPLSFPGEAFFVRKEGRSSGGTLGGMDEEEDHDNSNNGNETGDDDNEEVEDDEDDDDNDYDYDDDEDDGVQNQRTKHHHHHQQQQNQGGIDNKSESKMASATCMSLRMRSLSTSPPLSLSLTSSSPPVAMEQLRSDLMGSLASLGGEQEQRQWLKRKAAELEEQRMGYQSRALELERQRFKWLRFSSNKEREMERMKLSNERRCLENDRMLLLLRQKEKEVILNTNATVTANANNPSNPNPLQFAADHLCHQNLLL
ncbi:LOW QUALITY PROTEIN: putative DNA helicase INO80 [Asparagus officinalis]|uniref:LOW QUALITY PROTEIN: putative DNA helicase INO80 n=1 Tax=Asparagus officinalis TaxID=4686 RepID=UPI00098E62B6|nr:LOW QUALITY PROTEIN: putative DNA helicase INO80 [Asparagus officinalis]